MEEEQLHVLYNVVAIGVDAVNREEDKVVGLPAADYASVGAFVSLLVQPCEEGLERQLFGNASVVLPSTTCHVVPQM